MSVLLSITLSLLAVAGADEKSRPRRLPEKTTDACKALTAADIRRVQKSPLTQTRPVAISGDDSLSMRHCYFETAARENSVSLLIGVPSAKSPKAAREYWNTHVLKAKEVGDEEAEREQEGEGEEKQERRPPERVDGVGEQAFWVGDRSAGSLYVLKGDLFIRVSVGGKLTPEEKKARSKQLAQAVLSRM